MISAAVGSGRYRVRETIGRGGMGEVFLADDVMLDRQVALKFLTSAPHDGDTALNRLITEARAAAALDHPFICKIYEVAELDGRPCIVMEYVTGETLDRRLRRGALPVTETLRLADEIAEALEAAHKRRLVHRDLKPANVIVTEGNHVKVMDFGLATRLPPSAGGNRNAPNAVAADTQPVVGTPAYMSPEQASGEQVDRRSDIFAFGILLYQLLSGIHPFLRTSIAATLSAILQHDPADLHAQVPAVPPALAEAIARMLAKDPSERHQSFGDVRLDLRRLAGELTAQTTPDARLLAQPVASDTRGVLVGRESEHAELLRAIRSAAAGHGSMVVLEGEAGVGKSRLADEALAEARRLGCLTLVGRCYEQAATPPLVPYVELLEEAARLLPAPVLKEALGATAPELARLVPELHRLFEDMPPAMELPPEVQQRFLFNNVRDFLIRCSRLMPLAIFLDDLQWADESTVQLTQYLAPHLEKIRVVVIGAYRDVDVAPAQPRGLSKSFNQLLQRVRGQTQDAHMKQDPLACALEQLVGQRLVRLITVSPLAEASVASLLSTLGRKNPPATLVRTFIDETGGNPFFVEELFRYLNEEKRLFDAQGSWRRDLDLEEIDVPAGIRAVIARRLQRVDSRTHEMLTAAAIIGPYFELDLVEAVAGISGDIVVTALEQAEQAHLVKGPSGRQERRWRFAHQLICQALTAGVPQLTRQRFHVRVADAMERLDSESGTYTAEIAHHLYSAGPMADAGRTVHALMAAGDAADSVYATDDAVRQFRRVLEILREVRGLEAARPSVQERLADLLSRRGDRVDAMAHYAELVTLYEKIRSPIDQARIVRKMGTLHWQCGDRPQATTCFERALKALDGAAADVEAAHVYQELGLAAFRNGDNQQAIHWAERAVSAAEAALAGPSVAMPDARRMANVALAHATNTIGVALARSGQLEAGRARIEQCVALAREHDLLDVACRGYANLGVVYATIEPQRAIDASLTGLELATKIGAVSLQAYMYANLASAYCALTDRCETEGLDAAKAAAEIDRELGQLDHLAVPLIVMAQIHQCQGDLQQAQDTYRDALALAEKVGEPQLLIPCYDGLATIHLDRGDRTLAEQYMQKAQDLCQRAGIDPDALLVLPFLC